MSSSLASDQGFVKTLFDAASKSGIVGQALYVKGDRENAMLKFREAFEKMKLLTDEDGKAKVNQCSIDLQRQIHIQTMRWLNSVKAICENEQHQQQSPTGDVTELPPTVSANPFEEYAAILKHTIVTDPEEESFENMVGADKVKKVLFDKIINPIRYPEAFPNFPQKKGFVISFGPPGTFKTRAFYALCHELKQDWNDLTVFKIGQQFMKSKWKGDSSKLVHAFFDMVRKNKPAIVLFDEGDALLSEKNNADGPDDGVIAGFLTETDPSNPNNDKIFLYLTTNNPEVITAGFNRRFTVRLYHGLPQRKVRMKIASHFFAIVFPFP